MAIKGVTYSKQTVSAADHAALFQALLSDGILYGCGASFRNQTLTISSGAFVIAGRMTKIEGSYSISVSDAISNQEVRLVGVCDMTGAATESTFGQFYFRIQQKENDAYPSLIIQDVNTGDPTAKYEIEWARLTIGANGIITKCETTIAQSESQSGGGNTLTENDFEFPAGSYAFTASGDDWMLALKASGTFKLKKKIANIDMFLLSAGENGQDSGIGSRTWGKGGKGGKYYQPTSLTLSKGEYTVTIGANNSADSSFAASVEGGETYSSASGSEDDRKLPANLSGGNGNDGVYPWGDSNCLSPYTGIKYGPSGGNGGYWVDATSQGTKGGGLAGEENGTVSGIDRPGEGGFIDSTVGNRTHSATGFALRDGWPGGDNTGCGGGGAAYQVPSGGGSNTGAGGEGGSGIILIRPHKGDEPAA